MFEFAWPLLGLLLPLPWLVRWALPEKKDVPEGIMKVPFFQRLKVIADSKDATKIPMSVLIKIMAAIIWLCMVLAIMRPEWLGEPVAIERQGRDIMMAIDISGSMGSPDLVEDQQQLSRFDVVRDVANKFAMEREGDRVGLILFGTRAYLQTPLTFDHKTVVEMLDDASIGLAGPRTAVGDSIGLAIKRLMNEKVQSRLLILLTDGASNSGSVTPVEAAKLAAKENIKIYTIGIGADSMTVNTLFGSRRVNPSRDLDEKTLKAIADETGGLYFRAKNKAGLEKIYEAINELEPVAQEANFFKPVFPLYLWPLGTALLLSLSLAGWLHSGRGRIV